MPGGVHEHILVGQEKDSWKRTIILLSKMIDAEHGWEQILPQFSIRDLPALVGPARLIRLNSPHVPN
jgi:hypothetical protein